MKKINFTMNELVPAGNVAYNQGSYETVGQGLSSLIRSLGLTPRPAGRFKGQAFIIMLTAEGQDLHLKDQEDVKVEEKHVEEEKDKYIIINK